MIMIPAYDKETWEFMSVLYGPGKVIDIKGSEVRMGRYDTMPRMSSINIAVTQMEIIAVDR